jgi:hypothetical protein
MSINIKLYNVCIEIMLNNISDATKKELALHIINILAFAVYFWLFLKWLITYQF